MEPLAFTVKSFSVAHNQGITATYKEINAKRLRIMKVGKSTRISTESAAAWRKAREKDAELGQSPNPKSPRKAKTGRRAKKAKANGAAA